MRQFFMEKRKGIKTLLVLAVLLSFFGLWTAGCSGAGTQEVSAAEQAVTDVVIIHNNPCEACREEERLQELFTELAPTDIAAEYELKILYAYNGEGAALAEEAAAYFGMEKGSILYPLVLVGDQCLMGNGQMEEGLTALLEEAVENGVTQILPQGDADRNADAAGTASGSADGQNALSEGEAGQKEWSLDVGAARVHVLFFSTESSHNCENVQQFLDSLPQTVIAEGTAYPLEVTKLSVAEGDNIELFEALAEQYGVPENERQVPMLFIGEHCLLGEKQILKETESLLTDGLGAVYRAKSGAAQTGQAWDNLPVFLLKTLGVGFLNGFNPCALSLVLLFLSLIAAMPEGFTKYGLSFIAGKFLAYVLLGAAAAAALGTIDFEGFSMARSALKVFLAVFCLVLAAGNLLDCYHAAKGEYGKIRVQLPGRLRRFNDSFVKKMVNEKTGKLLTLLIFAGSMVIACGEFFCTGQIYLASVLQWISQSGGSKIPLLAFVLYSLALCLPSFVIFCLVKKGKSVFALTGESLKRMPVIKFFNGVLFILFAALALYY